MKTSRRAFLGMGAITLASGSVAAIDFYRKAAFSQSLPTPEYIALNRMGFGPKAGDIEALQQVGLTNYIEEQLNPDEQDDTLCHERLQQAQLLIEYEAGEGYAALSEERPLNYLSQSVQALWPLTNFETAMGYEERVRPAYEVQTATWIRAVYSRWQLKEVLVDFWHNHFSVNTDSAVEIATTLPAYDRDVIRQHTLGNFRAFLEAVAQSPAMLYYLNNVSSKASPANENYARELFELHTLGAPHYFNHLYHRWREVPGATEGKPIGYIDQDVYEAARAFTGWTIANGQETYQGEVFANTGEFLYHDHWHDNYQKRVLGVEFDPNQPPLADGRKVLDLVAYHPATANYVCTKLCQRLVADHPPESLVTKAVQTWMAHQKSPDQIKQTVRSILLSPEFTQTWGQKVKRPFELVASFLRATEAEFTPTHPFFWLLDGMGYKQFAWPTPTGNPDAASYWLSTNLMLGRWNSFLALQADWVGAASFDLVAKMPNANLSSRQIVDFWVGRLLGRDIVESSRERLLEFLADGSDPDQVPTEDAADLTERVQNLVALIAMMPEYQVL
jgi:uncharacterized protein (DUF1800 family)